MLNLSLLEESKARLVIACLMLIVLVAVGSLVSPTFTRPTNLFNLARQGVGLGLVSIGQTFVMVSGGVDLSVGATVSLTSCLTAGLMNGKMEMIIPAILLGLFVGAIIGLTNGLVISGLRVPPFITTFGMMGIIQGVNLLYTHRPIGAIPPGFGAIGQGHVGPVPIAIIFFVPVFALAWFVLRRTTLGRYIHAVGGSETIAYLSGIKSHLITNIAYLVGGVTAAVAGIFLVSRAGSGDPLMGTDMAFDSVTAALIGGVSLAGGRGSLFGTLTGVFILCLINNILNMLNVFGFWQWVVKGLILLVALATYRVKS